jgi:DNA primase
MKYSEELIEEIKQHSDIVDIISEVVDLNKSGANFKGLCPFHNEKTPSFMVSQEKGIYKCFGCGASGNAISFMMNYHGYSFMESIKELASKAGIKLPEYRSEKANAELTKRDIVLNTLKEANNFFQKMLTTTAGKNALAYFHGRGYHSEVIKTFELGYSPDSWNGLMDHMNKNNISEDAMLDAGLIIDNEEKKSRYDRFRGRAMFPIHNITGKVIAFGSRILTDDKDQPKYINSPQTIVFDKSSTLYGLYHAKNNIRLKKFAIMTEGYADVISLHKAGFNTAVASSGTSLTEDQLKVLTRYCKEIYFCFDSDQAGVKATAKAIGMALPLGYEVRIIKLPKGEDPDSIIREASPDVFKMYFDKAQGFIEYLVDQYREVGVLDSPATMAKSIRRLVKLVSSIPDRLQHDLFLRQIADILKITDKQLENIYLEKTIFEKNSSSDQRKVYETPEPKKQDEEQPKAVDNSNLINVLPIERILIKLALSNYETLKILTSKFKVTRNIFISPDARDLFDMIIESADENSNIVDRIVSNKDHEKEYIDYLVGLTFNKEEGSDKWSETDVFENIENMDKNIRIIINNLNIKKIDIELENIKAKLQNPEAEDMENLMIRMNELIKQKKSFQ